MRPLVFRSLVLAAIVVVSGIGCQEKAEKNVEKKGEPPPLGVSSASAPAAGASASAPTAASSAPAKAAVPDAIAAQHVLVAYKGAKDAPKGVTRSKDDARKRAEEVVAKAKGGTDFSAIVAEYSDDPGSKERMGSVGKFTRDKMVKPFSDAAFALGVGEVSGVVETPFGFHVIKRNQ